MDGQQKQLANSLIRAFEDLLIEKNALKRIIEIQGTPEHVLKAAVASLLNDRTIGGIVHLRFGPLYDLVEHAPDVSTVVESLLANVQRQSQE